MQSRYCKERFKGTEPEQEPRGRVEQRPRRPQRPEQRMAGKPADGGSTCCIRQLCFRPSDEFLPGAKSCEDPPASAVLLLVTRLGQY